MALFALVNRGGVSAKELRGAINAIDAIAAKNVDGRGVNRRKTLANSESKGGVEARECRI